MGFHLRCVMCGGGHAKFIKTDEGIVIFCEECPNKEEYNDGDSL